MTKVKVYRSVNGDTWDLIAYKIYGDEKYFHQLMRANPNLLSIAIFSSNVPIIIPDIAIDKNSSYSSKLLPWKSLRVM